jgi:predicted  nucleic acid-binding Zn-ribbon protein
MSVWHKNPIFLLTALKAKLDADTTSTVALSDEKTITGSYRIYALVIPQGYILSSADRVNAVSDMLSAVAIKLQARMTADQTAGKDVTALQTSLADMNAKIADAKVQASAAQTRVVSLIPDGGDKTQMSSNTAALKSARADIRVASSDLEAARKDAKSIMSSLKSEKVNTSEKTSASTN